MQVFRTSLFVMLTFLILATSVQAADYTFVRTWGSAGSGNGQFNGPMGVSVDSEGNVYVVDSNNNRIQKFDSDGTYLTKWGSYGSGNGQFRSTFGVSVDSAGNVYVSDYNNNRIQKFDSDGTYLTKWGSYGTGNGEFRYQYGVSVDSARNVYVADTYNHRIQVFEPVPVVNAGPDATINEGDTFSSPGSFTDPGSDSWTATVDYGDGSAVHALALTDKTFALSHTYADNCICTVTVTVTDDDGGAGTDTATVTVNNAAPVVNAGPDATINEGDTFSSLGSFTDPGSDSWTATVDYGDGSVVHALTLTGKTFGLSHTYADNCVCTVTVTVTDDDGGAGTDTATVTVYNAAPVVDAGVDQTVVEGASVSFSGRFTDAGAADTHTIAWDFGDGGTASGILTPVHTYADNGVYTVRLTVTDDDGGIGTDTATVTVNNVAPVIIDPLSGPAEPLPVGSSASVTASFTDAGSGDTHTCTLSWDNGQNPVAGTVSETGGGWINSPATACPVLCNGAQGKANFGFVSKYKKGQSIPAGETEFQFKAGDMNFHSTIYEWLVVAGAKAQYKGSGTINGAGNYGFLLTATDGQISGGGGVDKFRIKIVNKDTDVIVYDNKFGESDDIDTANPQEIGGGSIVIHKEKVTIPPTGTPTPTPIPP